MSLLDLFKPRAKFLPRIAPALPTNPACDVSKTHIIAALFRVPKARRDHHWREEFYEHVATASFTCGQPQTLTGPDGFTYFILRTPDPDVPFESFCIGNMKTDFLLEKGWGVVFNPAADKTADWVFTYGAIVNLHLNGHFVSPIDDRDLENIEFVRNVGRTRQSEQVMTGQPSEEYLPRCARAALRRFLQGKGISDPKVMLVTSQHQGKIVRKLALNIDEENYPVTPQLDYLMQQVGWYLPNDYILIPLSEKNALAKGYHPL